MLLRDSQGNISCFQVKGHSGFDEAGQDIVCSAVSAIVQTAIMGLTDIVGIKPLYHQKNGLANFKIPLDIPNEKMEKVGIVLETMLLGLKSIELGYDEYITIREREVE